MLGHYLSARFMGRPARYARDLLILSRPVAALCAGAELLVGAHLARQISRPLADAAVLLREGIAISLVTAAVNVVNDIRDVRADAISRPHRPLPAGRLSTPDAWRLASLQGISALMLSVGVPAGPAVTLALLLIGIGYSYLFKGTVLAGNLVVAFLAATPIMYGARLGGVEPGPALITAIIIFLFMFAYEVLKTIRDAIADSAAGYRTVATQWGIRSTAVIFRISLTAYAFIAVALTLFVVSAYYVFVIWLAAVIPSLIVGWRFPVDRSPVAVQRVLRVMALSWVAGLVVLPLVFRG